MAFCNKLGSLVRQSVSQNGPSPMGSMLNAVRCMSSKLFVGGLSYNTDDHTLKEAFDRFGDVVDVKVILDRDTGRSRGFGFVNFSDSEAANSAMSGMDGQELQGRNIRVSLANERSSAPRTYNNYRGGGGGGGGGGDGGYDAY
ncbi:Glycine-rich RNA-binding protein 2, mitochondrial [Linum grandiflorum]